MMLALSKFLSFGHMGSSSLDQNEILEVESALEQAIVVKANHIT